MSEYLVRKVWQSNLPSHLKPLAVALADMVNNDGASVCSSVEHMAWLWGRSKRSVQAGLAELKSRSVLEVVAHRWGGRGHPTEYQFVEENLPERVSWEQLRAQECAALTAFPGALKGEERQGIGEISAGKRVQPSKEKGEGSDTPLLCDPSATPDEPPTNRPRHTSRLNIDPAHQAAAGKASDSQFVLIAVGGQKPPKKQPRSRLEEHFGDLEAI